MPGELLPYNERNLTRANPVPLPSIVLRTGGNAGKRFLEFFAANIRNGHTRRAYFRHARNFFKWCESWQLAELSDVQPMHVAAYVEERLRDVDKPSVKQELAAIKMLFDWLVVGQIVPMNPAGSVRGPKHSVTKGKTPVLVDKEAHELLESINVSDIVGLRDRAIIATMLYTFGRVGAGVGLAVGSCYVQGRRLWLRLDEKNGKVIEVPCHHNLEEYLHAYIDAAGIADEKDAPLFRSVVGKTKVLTKRPLYQQNVYDMIRRRALKAGIKTKIGNHSMRGTGITNYLEHGGTVEAAQRMAGHADPRTTKLYDRRGDKISLDDVERISF
jgi:site-specific recombinase XerD